jgi:hypothetical protein
MSSPFCPSSSHTGKLPYLPVTPVTLFRISPVTFATFARLHNYKPPGLLSTFDFRVEPEHRLVTSGLYSFVRHPAYPGSVCFMAELTFVGLTHRSRTIERAVGSHKPGDAHYTVSVDPVVGGNYRSLIRKSRGEERTDEEQVW